MERRKSGGSLLASADAQPMCAKIGYIGSFDPTFANPIRLFLVCGETFG